VRSSLNNPAGDTSEIITAKYEGPVLFKLGETNQQEEGQQNPANFHHIYSFSYWAQLGEKITFEPVAVEPFLYYPIRQTIYIKDTLCPPPVSPFHTRPGLYLTGKVEPGLSDTTIKIYNAETGVEIARVQTDLNGFYSAGPLYDDSKYNQAAVRTGYEFTTIKGPSNFTGTSFRGLKLGQITVIVRDQDTNETLPGVLQSLSSGTYRSNNPTNANGTVTFFNLFPNSYFLRPLLKEYVFRPTTKSIEITEGEEITVEFSAKRIAYSCFGRVTSLNGNPEHFVTLEATTMDKSSDEETQSYEETQSDAKGYFRLRGLNPEKQYIVRVKRDSENNKRFERASPQAVSVNVSNLQDYRDVHFIIFRRSNRFHLTGSVSSDPPQFLSTLSVSLYSSSSGKALRTVKLGPSTFFDFDNLPTKDKYSIQIHTTLSSRTYSFSTKPIPISFDEFNTTFLSEERTELSYSESNLKYLTLIFEAHPHPIPQEIAHTPFFALLFVVLAIAAAVYNKKIIQFAKSVISREIFNKETEQDRSKKGSKRKGKKQSSKNE